MKEELQAKLVEVLTSIQTAAGKASDFALDQLPDIAQSYVAYGRAVTAVSTVVLLVLGVSMLAIARWAYKNPWNISQFSWEKDEKRSKSNVFVVGVGSISGVAFLVIAPLKFDYLVWIAPKVWLLKELASLIK